MVKQIGLKTGDRTNMFELTRKSDTEFTIAHLGELHETETGMTIWKEAMRGRTNLRLHKISDLNRSEPSGLHRAILDALEM